MKVALVHDFMREFGGAERVLRVLADMYPKAPIYVAFKNKGTCVDQFLDRRVIESKWALVIGHWRLYSVFRFLIPLVWRSIDLSKYDLVITSCSSYVARGFKVGEKTKVVAYCHTPPRMLYGYESSITWMKSPVMRLGILIYGYFINHYLRLFDFWSAQKVDKWMVNSENVQQRVEKYYRRDSEVVYPPFETETLIDESGKYKKDDYFLIVSRLVGAKGLVEAAKAARDLDFQLKIVGEAVGFGAVEEELRKIRGVELVGRVDDQRLIELYSKARGFIALAKDEDFGMTLVEAQACGLAVIAYRGGGYLESVMEGETGVFVEGTDKDNIEKGMKEFIKIKWKREILQKNARRFSREEFEGKVRKIVKEVMKNA